MMYLALFHWLSSTTSANTFCEIFRCAPASKTTQLRLKPLRPDENSNRKEWIFSECYICQRPWAAPAELCSEPASERRAQSNLHTNCHSNEGSGRPRTTCCLRRKFRGSSQPIYAVSELTNLQSHRGVFCEPRKSFWQSPPESLLELKTTAGLARPAAVRGFSKRKTLFKNTISSAAFARSQQPAIQSGLSVRSFKGWKANNSNLAFSTENVPGERT